MPTYQIHHGEQRYPIEREQLAETDLLPTGNGQYHLLQNGLSYHCEVLDFDRTSKQITVRINGRKFELAVRDEVDQLVEQLGLSAVVDTGAGDVHAPMPGLILDILVGEGDEIEAGTPLVVLEAMKMENVLKAEGSGTVKSIEVSKGDAVEKRQLLIRLE